MISSTLLTQVEKLRRQVNVRFFCTWYYTQPEVDILIRRNRLVCNNFFLIKLNLLPKNGHKSKCLDKSLCKLKEPYWELRIRYKAVLLISVVRWRVFLPISVWPPNIEPKNFRTRFAKRPWTMLGSTFWANLDTPFSKNFSGRVPSHSGGPSVTLKFPENICTGYVTKISGYDTTNKILEISNSTMAVIILKTPVL